MCEEMESIDEIPSIQISEEMESSGKMASTQIRVAEASTHISEAMESKRKEMEIKRKEMEMIKNDLLIMAMKGDWDKVVDTYSNPVAHKVKIRSGDTALHMAISDGKEETVKMLIDQIKSPQEGGIEALKIKNKLGNTPLHLAVSMGTVAMCKWIAQVDPLLVGDRNKAGETPFFLAAFHGRKEIFLHLLRICDRYNGLLYCRRGNGETILHVAIAGDYFDLAFQIIHLYPELVNYFDHEGFSPLHRLAGNPSNFRSGSYFGLYDKIIYHCLLVDELQVDPKVLKEVDPKVPVEHQEDPKVKKKSSLRFLENVHGGCVSVFQSFWKYMLQQVMGKKGDHTAELDLERDPGSEATNIGAPRNYVTCFEFLKLPLKAVWVVLGPGYAQLRRIHDKKQKHIWSVQIMNELLAERAASTTKYINTGTAPPTLPTDAYDSIFNDISSEISQKSNSPTPASLEANRSDKSEGKDASREGKEETHEKAKNETTILIAAKNGVTKISESIKEYFPVAIRDMNLDNKNIMLLTVENKSADDLLMGKGMQKGETPSPILIAAKNGITEIVEKILERIPMAIHDMNAENKNIVLLAVENRQSDVYQLVLLLKEKTLLHNNVFQVVDNEGNSALHLAAKLGDYKPRLIPGAALQMQWEIKWFEFVRDSMPPNFFPCYNMNRKTPEDLFTESHSDLVKEGGKWLNKTSDSCSVIAALIATVAFATSATVPGGVNEKSGTPRLENQPAFNVFATSSLVALCFSITAVITFHIFILTTPDQESDFGRSLPTKLLVGLTSLFISIASMLISLCAGHFIMVQDKLKHAAIPVYIVACLPVMCYAVVQFPLYVHLLWAIFKKVPQRSYKAVHHAL